MLSFQVKRIILKKVTAVHKKELHIFAPLKFIFQRFPGCFSAYVGKTEIIPVEPDQGNACAGR